MLNPSMLLSPAPAVWTLPPALLLPTTYPGCSAPPIISPPASIPRYGNPIERLRYNQRKYAFDGRGAARVREHRQRKKERKKYEAIICRGTDAINIADNGLVDDDMAVEAGTGSVWVCPKCTIRNNTAICMPPHCRLCSSRQRYPTRNAATKSASRTRSAIQEEAVTLLMITCPQATTSPTTQ
mmetsp:Transcript_14205/g.23532  ORF Transcript_14205/g.23532 Transcript_14205/m.23532 type:complete len:183 (+) Transcript_14205:433-981(+)